MYAVEKNQICVGETARASLHLEYLKGPLSN